MFSRSFGISLLFALFSHNICLSKTEHVLHYRSDKVAVDDNGYDIVTNHINAHASDHYLDFHKFVTRPDIDAPRWNITVYNTEAVSPGYWFVAPYEDTFQREAGGEWVGPYIYDGNGELVWSGAPKFEYTNALGFTKTQIGGEDALTFIYGHKHGTILDNKYRVLQDIDVADKEGEVNVHEFNTVDNGTRLLLMKTVTKLEQISGPQYEGDCHVRFYGFEERDSATYEPTFEWSSEGHIDLAESMYSTGSLEKMCTSNYGYDYIHGNAVDKFPDGDYLLSARNTDALYKISGRDGSIIWRFGGRKSDFEFDDHFQGQHDARVHSQNNTNIVISFLDNANTPAEGKKGKKTAAPFSRGMMVSLRTDTTPMTARVVALYNHPHEDYATGRGSVQILPNRNVFIGWAIHSLHSEHGPDGELIMEAQTRPDLKAYRSFKFPWVGHPTQPPDVHSEAVFDAQSESTSTVVHISWNGATEVATWMLYKTEDHGELADLVATAPREGFETLLVIAGFAEFVVAHALDAKGEILGKSNVIKTMLSSNNQTLLSVQKEGTPILQDFASTPPVNASMHMDLPRPPFTEGRLGVGFLLGALSCVITIVLIAVGWTQYVQFRARRTGWLGEKEYHYEELREEGDELYGKVDEDAEALHSPSLTSTPSLSG